MVAESTKRCSRCNTAKPVSEFGRNKARQDGVQVYCKCCMKSFREANNYDKARWVDQRERESERNRIYRAKHSERLAILHRISSRHRRIETPWKINAANKARKAAQRRAIPAWADMAHIALIYRKAKELSAALGIELQVDHIVPLRSKIVCGLHTPDNLQLLAKEENNAKRNYEWPDMP